MGRLVEIYEPWEKPGILTKQDVAKVIKRIEKKLKAEIRIRRINAQRYKTIQAAIGIHRKEIAMDYEYCVLHSSRSNVE